MKKLLFAIALALPMFAITDPGAPGPLAVTREEYNFGDTAVTLPGFPGPVEALASVHYPTGLAAGPYPVVMLMHGRHSTCYTRRGATALRWPCPAITSPIPSYQGYDYLATNLASWGYIVVSVSANGINAVDNSTADAGMQARAQLMQYHLDVWKTFNTTGGAPFGTKFAGKADLNRVGTMGHSRGGEGVVTHFQLNKSLGSPYGIKAVFPLAPVDFSRPVINNVPMTVMLPYCDGDVSDLQGMHFYDDARYNVPGDLTVKNSILAMGANHNFFNTVWTPGLFPAGAVDDWAFVSGGAQDLHCSATKPANGRLTDAQQRAVGLAYMAGFFRMNLGGEDFAAYFSGDASRPASIGSSTVWVSYHAPDSAATRKDVNRLVTSSNLTVNTVGGAASQTGITPYTLCGGDAPQPRECVASASDGQQPHTTQSSIASTLRGLSQLDSRWAATTAKITNDLPAGQRNLSGYTAVVFRVGVNFSLAPAGLSSDFTVSLVDGTAATFSTKVSSYSGASFFPPGNVSPVPKIVLNTIRIPLSAFPSATLADIRQVAFQFDQRTSGAVLISDIAFVK